MCNTKELKTKEANLLKAFKDPGFEEKLTTIRLEVEAELKSFITYLKLKLDEGQKVYENIESRVKSEQSFREKIYRKDYIKEWEISDNKTDNQKLIAMHLPDLLGFRINCFFWQDEEVIYEKLREYYEQNNFTNIVLDFSENTTQLNGHKIYKLSGIYDQQYNFEIQIKSIMHNIWGEVEHKAIYKNRDYDADILNKKAITEEVFNILRASDKQLVSLFKKQNDERQLTYALFYEKTKKVIVEKTGTDILARHYNGYFEVFSDSENFKHIKRYVAHALLENEFVRQTVSTETSDRRVEELNKKITDEFLEYNLKCLYYIYELIYDVPDFRSFTLLLSKYLLEVYAHSEDDGTDAFGGDGEDDEMDAFGEHDEESQDYTVSVLTMLEDKIGGRKKND